MSSPESSKADEDNCDGFDTDDEKYGEKYFADDEKSGGENPNTTIPLGICFQKPKREKEEDILQKLREEGIIPKCTNRKPISFYIAFSGNDEVTCDQKCEKANRKKPKTSGRIKSAELFDPVEKLIIADVRHQEMLREKGTMGRNYKERYTKVKENQQKKAEDLRKKVEEKWKAAGEKIKKKEKRNISSAVAERVTNARKRKDSLEKEFKQKTAKKLQEEEEKVKRLEMKERESIVEKRLSRALQNREELLQYRQKMYEEKIKRVEESRKRREEMQRKMNISKLIYSPR